MGSKIRVVARLDIKNNTVVKTIQLDGLRVVGDPEALARKYYTQGADEIIYLDIVASLYGRNMLSDLIKQAVREVFIPLTAGGGVRSLNDVDDLLNSGADKVAVNTAALKRPMLISEIANRYGSQCMVLSIEAKKVSPNNWEAYVNSGRDRSGVSVIDWVKKAEDLGAGEILLTSIDREGTRRGFDQELVSAVIHATSIPVIVSGGYGNEGHLKYINKEVSAIAFASVLHYNEKNINGLKNELRSIGFDTRTSSDE